MASKGVKIGLTYIITVIVTLIVFGFIGNVFIEMLLGNTGSDETDTDLINQSNEYTPSSADNKTLLAIADLGDKNTDLVFMLIRFLPEETQSVFLSIPENTIAGETPATLESLYRTGSATAVKNALEYTLGLAIDKYIILYNSSFTEFCNFFVGPTYLVPYNLIYTDPQTSEQTVILAETMYLDGTTVSELSTFPAYKQGEEERARIAGELLTTMLSAKLTAGNSNLLESYFSTLINSTIVTDISRFDFEESYPALLYTVQHTDSFCRQIFPTLNTESDGNYTLDQSFLSALPTWFNQNTEYSVQTTE
jgi:anionic cell wall polymer biosynthesis LytR-Cps2A-Psr (LCP) family protein